MFRPHQPPVLIALSCLIACGGEPVWPATVTDPHSFSRPSEVRVTHVKLDLTLDFEARLVRGRATLLLQRTDLDAPLVLDTQALDVASVTGADHSPRAFDLGEPVGRLGRPLTIQLDALDSEISVEYATTRAGEALQFLGPEQTAGGEHPFLFTQGQAILTRSWIPLQDSPGVRVTYDATIVAPRPLSVLMSAGSRAGPLDLVREAGPRPDLALWRFRMVQPIPSYLIALACGELEERALSARCSIWAEPDLIAAAADEFAENEAMVQAAEKLFGPYRWGRYDVLVLPPAFPYGGMENPTLTFLTPTAIAGDRSLVSIIAHELAHSWSGNLVTNATWSDFWLNEGFTVYFERRIMQELYGERRVAMERLLDFRALERELAELEPWQTVLHVDLEGHHPDDGFSGVPYQKGALVLHRLEELFGRERLDRFLTSWFDEHAFTSQTTAAWVAFLQLTLLDAEPELAAQFDLDLWLEQPGLPPDAPRPVSDALDTVDSELRSLAAGTAPGELATEGWVTQQWLRFLDGLSEDLGPEGMQALDAAFGFGSSGNNEILASWLKLGIRHGYSALDARLEQFLMNVGRRKFLMPLYKELCSTPAGRERAQEIYARARPRYHAVSAISLDAVVNDE